MARLMPMKSDTRTAGECHTSQNCNRSPSSRHTAPTCQLRFSQTAWSTCGIAVGKLVASASTRDTSNWIASRCWASRRAVMSDSIAMKLVSRPAASWMGCTSIAIQ